MPDPCECPPRKALEKIADDSEASYWELRNWLDKHERLGWVHGDDSPAYPFLQIMHQARAAIAAPCPCEELRTEEPSTDAWKELIGWAYSGGHDGVQRIFEITSHYNHVRAERDRLRAQVEALEAGNVKANALDKFADVVKTRNEDVETIRQLRAELTERDYQIWDLRNFLYGISIMSDAPLMAQMAAQVLGRNSEPGKRRGETCTHIPYKSGIKTTSTAR